MAARSTVVHSAVCNPNVRARHKANTSASANRVTKWAAMQSCVHFVHRIVPNSHKEQRYAMPAMLNLTLDFLGPGPEANIPSAPEDGKCARR
ncbi:formate acetyltransferase [Anopheles sinensis]|uniref:Formate acetyltransferase n=1 Tax=Anopheles sinensis TaxID=74873 RepID=A0A084VTE2_ANOSI|nr:formate acetyltransferase [Anopheles sinensis]